MTLAERLRKLPLGYFGKRDLADLTETVMGDVNRLEHVWSHCLGYLSGAFISTAIIAVCLFAYDWRLAIACLWGVPVAFLLLFGSRKMSKSISETAKASGIAVSDCIQETIENIREIRATNQEQRFLEGLNQKLTPTKRIFCTASLWRVCLSTARASLCASASPPRFRGRVAHPFGQDRLHGFLYVPHGHHPHLRAV